jgi:hypothetical protein
MIFKRKFTVPFPLASLAGTVAIRSLSDSWRLLTAAKLTKPFSLISFPRPSPFHPPQTFYEKEKKRNKKMNFNANPEVNAHGASRPAKPRSLSLGNNPSKFSAFNRGPPVASHPPLPTRSPLRPTPDPEATSPHSPLDTWMFRSQNLPSSPRPLNSRSAQRPSVSNSDMNHFARPELLPTLPSFTDETSSLSLTLVDEQPEPPVATKIPKRTHALLELLSSERAYASDLAFIRDTHLPMALGV